MHVGMCVHFSFPCPSMHISGSLKKNKKEQGLRDSPTPPGHRGQRFGLWQVDRAEGGTGSWEEASGKIVSEPPFGRPSPIFPTSVAQRVKVSFLFPSIKKVPGKGKNLRHLFIMRNKTVGGPFQVSSQCLGRGCLPRVWESPSPRERPLHLHPSLLFFLYTLPLCTGLLNS